MSLPFAITYIALIPALFGLYDKIYVINNTSDLVYAEITWKVSKLYRAISICITPVYYV